MGNASKQQVGSKRTRKLNISIESDHFTKMKLLNIK